MIRVLVVEDAAVARDFLVYVLSADPAIEVVGAAANGEEAIEAVEQKRPDVITMDVHMPKMNGIDATRKIMETFPTPIVIVSGSANSREASWAFPALEAGALAAVERPAGMGHPRHEPAVAELLRTVKLMSEVKVVRRWTRPSQGPVPALQRAPAGIKLVAMGSSTGGPPVLQKILSQLPANLPFPVLMVQHISPGFVNGLAEWLGNTSALPVHVAAHGEQSLPGNAYLAGDGFQLGVESGGRLALTNGPPEHSHRPSVSYLFRSVARAFGEQAIGVLLTGMGKDGAEELMLMKSRGAITIAQDKESSAVHGMPGEAIQLGGATFVLAPDRMAALLAGLTNQGERTPV